MPFAAEYNDSDLGPYCDIRGCLVSAFAWFDEHWHCLDHTEQVIEKIEAQWIDPRNANALAASGIWEHLAYR